MTEKKRGLLLVISGFSGVGKGTIVRKLMQEHPEQFSLSISATSRKPREKDVEGVDYFFKSREEFEEMIENDMLLEHACYVGNYYGTPRAYVEEQLEKGKDVILEIEQQGAFNVKKAMPQAVLIFIAPPSVPELERRLRKRNTESEETIQLRLARALEEADGIEAYEYFVVNDNADLCARKVYNLIEIHHCRTEYREDEIVQLRNELVVYRKEEK